MLTRKSCRACRGQEFLGVECAWPATDCLGSIAQGRPLRRWPQRIATVGAAIALAALLVAWLA